MWTNSLFLWRNRSSGCFNRGLSGIIWTQEEGSERRIVLGGMFGPKREEVREG